MNDPGDPSAPDGAARRERRQRRRRQEGAIAAQGHRAWPSIVVGVCVVSGITAALALGIVPHGIHAATTFGLPIAFGMLLGLFVPDTGWLARIVLICTCAVGVIGTILLQNLAGVFCSVVFAVVGGAPALVSGWLVVVVRRAVARRSPRRAGPRRFDLLLFLTAILLPFALRSIERRWPPHHANEALVVARDVAAPLAAPGSRSLRFPERGGAIAETIRSPLPRAAEGHVLAVGDEKTLRFDKGLIRVRVVEVRPGRELVAEVVEQSIEAKALTIHHVTVRCDPLGPDRTRATLRIDFTPKMGPRWYWRPFERFFGGITFEALLGAWQDEADSKAAAPDRAARQAATQ